MASISFTATGDSFITRRFNSKEELPNQLTALIREADIGFTNLEVTIHRNAGFPSAQSGGTWAKAAPEVLQDLRRYGFNVLAWANNHTLDYSYGGLQATRHYLEKHGFIHVGVGNQLSEANAVKYVECRSARVAVIAATSTFHESWAAGEQRPDMQGRPGINPLRYSTIHNICEERMKQLKMIAKVSGINADRDLAVKEGFSNEDKEGVFTFGQYQFKVSKVEGVATRPHAQDLNRILKSIGEARRQADYVFISLHSHEMKDGCKDIPADFNVEFARACIDEGAHAVVGHGPHIVRGIEIYKKRPIFYSLGNFIFQNDTVTHLPADFYDNYGLDAAHSTADALDERSRNNTRGLGTNPKVWSSVVGSWVMEDGELKRLTLYPIELGFDLPRYRRGWPQITKDITVLQEMQQLSKPFGTDLTILANTAEWNAGEGN